MTVEDRKSVLDERHERAIVALVAGRKPSVVAEEVGVTARQLRRWRTENPAFVSALTRAQAEAYSEARERVAGMLDAALDAVAEVLADKSAPAAVRVRCAEIIMARTLDANGPAAELHSAADLREAGREILRQCPELVDEIRGAA